MEEVWKPFSGDSLPGLQLALGTFVIHESSQHNDLKQLWNFLPSCRVSSGCSFHIIRCTSQLSPYTFGNQIMYSWRTFPSGSVENVLKQQPSSGIFQSGYPYPPKKNVIRVFLLFVYCTISVQF